ncbi:hypothetical protein CJF31_00006434 [Rutstroemia sp. NJR-2017a BVV2]|nr:hypothetical protein CJF31_00006434 [Rutstroemia sp. NJR-2017a BVV2]
MRSDYNEYATLSQIEVTSLSFAFEVVMAHQSPDLFHRPYPHSQPQSDPGPLLSSLSGESWTDRQNHSTSSLGEGRAGRGQANNIPTSHRQDQELPVFPGARAQGRSRRLDGRLVPYGQPLPRPSLEHRGVKSCNDAVQRQKTPQLSRFNSSPEARLQRPPMPPMSNSTTKVMQFTGRDPTREIIEGTRQRSPLHITIDESDSSGSAYSQDGQNSTADLPVTPLQPPPAHDSQYYLKSSTYSSGPSSPSDSGSISSQAYRERVTNFMAGHIGEPSPLANTRDAIEDSTYQNRVIYEQQQGKSGTSVHHEIHHEDHIPMPPPLTVRTKKDGQNYFREDPGGSSVASYTNVQKAADWNILGTPSREKQHVLHNTEAVSFSPAPAIRSQSSPLPFAGQKHTKRGSSSGKHPLRSPFPFNFHSTHKSPDSPNSASALGGKLSGTLRRVSGTKTNSPTNKIVTTLNTKRTATDPDTPTPKKSIGAFMGLKGTPDVLQKGNEHFHEVVEKAKLSMNKKEKRRQELKKRIVVVGVMDQTPG